MNKLVILRHGQAHSNLRVEAAYADHLNFLTLAGVQHAIEAAEHVKSREYRTCYVSEITRSRQTMSVILERLGNDHYNPSMPLVTGSLNEVRTPRYDDVEFNKAALQHVKGFVSAVLPQLELGHVLAVGHGNYLHHMISALWETAPESRPLGMIEFSIEHCFPYEIDAGDLKKLLDYELEIG